MCQFEIIILCFAYGTQLSYICRGFSTLMLLLRRMLLVCTLVTLRSDGVVTISSLVTQVSDHYSVTHRLDKTGIYMIHVLLLNKF